jgi:hypothetical protein
MFAKVFEQIFDSSIAEDWKVRLVFEDLLILADINGVVDKTPEAISRRTNVPLDVVQQAIAVLESPDHRSRRPDNEGRRIQRLDDHRDWGWFIVNYDYYRKIASEEQRRDKTKKRVQKLREKQSCNSSVTHSNASVTICNDSPSPSVDILRESFEDCWKDYPDKSGKEPAFKAFKNYMKLGVSVETVKDGIKRYKEYVEAKRNGGFKDLKYQNGSTWFNQQGWSNEYKTDTAQPEVRKFVC